MCGKDLNVFVLHFEVIGKVCFLCEHTCKERSKSSISYFKTCFLKNEITVTKLLHTLICTSRMSILSHRRNITECQFNLA